MNLNNFVGRSTVAIALVFAAATFSHAQSFTTQQPVFQGGFPQQGNFQSETLVQTPSEEDLKKASIGASFFDAGASTITVASVYTNSPAQKAGLQTGDMLKQLNGEAIANSQAFTAAISEMNPGDTITVSKFENEESTDVTISVSTMSDIMKASIVPDAGAYDSAINQSEQQLSGLRQRIKNTEMDLEDLKKTLAAKEKELVDLQAKAAAEKEAAEAKAAEDEEAAEAKAMKEEAMKEKAMEAGGSGTR